SLFFLCHSLTPSARIGMEFSGKRSFPKTGTHAIPVAIAVGDCLLAGQLAAALLGRGHGAEWLVIRTSDMVGDGADGGSRGSTGRANSLRTFVLPQQARGDFRALQSRSLSPSDRTAGRLRSGDLRAGMGLVGSQSRTGHEP